MVGLRDLIVHLQCHMIKVWREAPHVTLSNALDISRNARLTSIVKGQSKEELISWTIHNYEKMKDSPDMKPEWLFGEKNYCNKSDWINPSILISEISYRGLEVHW